jgi:hypothetical protein
MLTWSSLRGWRDCVAGRVAAIPVRSPLSYDWHMNLNCPMAGSLFHVKQGRGRFT